MTNILFVCLGNICRSPLAEAVFRQLVEARGLSEHISCDSAATHNYHPNQPADHRSRRVAADHGIKITHKARKITSDDFGVFDYIIAMDESILEDIQIQSHRSTGFELPEDRLFLYRIYDSEATETDLNVPDPYYEDIAAFENVYEMVLRCGNAFLDDIVTPPHPS
jgi:protein-tyrosine phosphatase